MTNYYLDTSIWLDLFEKRNEPNLSKARFAEELINKIIRNNDKIIYSYIITKELINLGYDHYKIKEIFNKYYKILKEVYTKKLEGKAKDLSAKRKIPFSDIMHALIARENNAVLVSRDRHFKLLLDIAKAKTPEEITYAYY